VLELTETSVMARPAHSLVVLDALHDLGVGLSIDDFGTATRHWPTCGSCRSTR
jgi:EAL domain-containing protein (putative c-di-GMP-specific phosphodiesterase class I)